jgi:hypothetical protein
MLKILLSVSVLSLLSCILLCVLVTFSQCVKFCLHSEHIKVCEISKMNKTVFGKCNFSLSTRPVTFVL